MKQKSRAGRPSLRWQRLLAAAIVMGTAHARAGDTNSPPMSPQDYFEGGTNTYTDWIELGGGAFLTHGNHAQAQENQQLADGPFGGIDDLHIQGNAFTNTLFTLDGHGIYDQHDYSLGIGLKRDDVGFLKLDFENFRTWFNGAGGYYPPTGTQYNLANDALGLDIGKISFEAGLTEDKLPKLTFKYTHSYREGDDSSTIWGPTHPDPLNSPTAIRGLAPGFYNLDEKIDTFELDAEKQIKATDVNLGFVYEHGDLNDPLYTTQYPLEPVQSDVTQNQHTTYDLFSGDASTETWLKKNLFLSTGLMFSDLGNSFSGSQIYGSTFDAPYSLMAPNPGLGYYNMTGDSHLQEYVMDVNLMAIPFKTLTITPAVRVEKENWDAESSGVGTLLNSSENFNSQSSRDDIDVSESLDVRYTGVTNWVYFARAEWEEGNGTLNQQGGLTQVNGFGPPLLAPVETDDQELFQKYTVGVRWYPLYRLTIDTGGYYKNDRWNYNNNTQYPDSYPGFIALQRFETLDGNCRVTYRPIENVSLSGRYEYQWSTVDMAPNAIDGFPEMQSSEMGSHILAADVTWIPWSRLSLQAGLNYVLSETRTPVSDYVPSTLSAAPILAAENNYWMANGSAMFVVDDKTDFNVAYYHYRADDYQDNATVGVPYGAGAQEDGITASLTRRLTQHLRWTLRYGFTHYTDQSSGGFNNFDAHLIFSSIQYRF